MKVFDVLNLIGNTPLLCLNKISSGPIYCKAEFLNPGGSIKDRIAKYMIENAEEKGLLKEGMMIMEPTSGNTGIGLSLVGTKKGYDVTIVMPENMSEERKKIIKAFGGNLILTPADESIGGAVNEVQRHLERNPNIFAPQQFENEDNAKIHYLTTANEIWNQAEGKVDIFISGLGSGGTLSGVGKYLKEKNPSCKIIAVEPKNVSALLGHEPGLHKIQGIGDGFIPSILDTKLIDDVYEVSDKEAIDTSRDLASREGLLVGTSSGANVFVAKKLTEKYGTNYNIVTILADRAERYFSTSLL
jgi:cysteine synthase A